MPHLHIFTFILYHHITTLCKGKLRFVPQRGGPCGDLKRILLIPGSCPRTGSFSMPTATATLPPWSPSTTRNTSWCQWRCAATRSSGMGSSWRRTSWPKPITSRPRRPSTAPKRSVRICCWCPPITRNTRPYVGASTLSTRAIRTWWSGSVSMRAFWTLPEAGTCSAPGSRSPTNCGGASGRRSASPFPWGYPSTRPSLRWAPTIKSPTPPP